MSVSACAAMEKAAADDAADIEGDRSRRCSARGPGTVRGAGAERAVDEAHQQQDEREESSDRPQRARRRSSAPAGSPPQP